MSSFVGTSSGSPHSLRTRWTPLDVRLTGRIVEEHQQLIATLQSGISNAGTFTTLASNAKMRGLVDTIAARRSAILEFIVHHRTLQGEADAQQIQAFEALLERLSSAEQRAWDWDGSRHLMITPGGSVITHRRPLVSAAANASYHAAQSPKRGVTPRKGTTLAPPVDHLLPQHHIVQPAAYADPASTAFTPKRRSRSAPHDSTSRQPSAYVYAADDVVMHSAPPCPPVGYLFDFSVEAEEIKARLALHHDEFFAADALLFRFQHYRPTVTVPRAPLHPAPSLHDVACSLRRMWTERHVGWEQVVLGVVALVLLLQTLQALVTILNEIDDLLDTHVRPYGRVA